MRQQNPSSPASPAPAAPFAAPAEKSYIVPMFPYPSGSLHMGHARVYAIADSIARAERMRGKTVLFPIGWDAFGLPAENAAIEKGVAPSEWTRANIAAMKKSLEKMNFSFDWSREIATCDPQTYRFSQLFFIKMLKAGLIYRSETAVQWDPVEKTVLAREQVIGGKGWRSGAVVEERVVPSWTARVTAYADELLAGFDHLDWPEAPKSIGRAWIGKQEDGSFRIHDWNVSRQRYWGCPAPVVECGDCGLVPVPEADLPVVLPEAVRLREPGNPLADMPEWRACACPQCQGPAQRSIETLDTFFDSSWYFLRYPSVGAPGSEAEPMVAEAQNWAPVDHYIGGIEHASMHLIYARFFSRALRDLGFSAPEEPFKRFTAQGIVCAPVFMEQTPLGERPISPADIERRGESWVAKASGAPVREGASEKMSKSKKNGQTIDEIMAAGHSADAIRFSLFFAGPFAQNINWTPEALFGAEKSLRRLKAACEAAATAPGGRDEAVEAAFSDFARRAKAERESGEGLNVTIGAGLGALRAAEKAIRSGSGGQSARRALMGVCACFFPIAPETAQAAARAIDPDWRAEAAGFPEPEAPAGQKIAIQANGKFCAAICAPEFHTAEEAAQWAFAHCPELAGKVDADRVEAIHWKAGRALNIVGALPGTVDSAQAQIAARAPRANRGPKA